MNIPNLRTNSDCALLNIREFEIESPILNTSLSQCPRETASINSYSIGSYGSADQSTGPSFTQPSTTTTFANSTLLKCYYFNSRSITNKLDSLLVMLDSHLYDVIFITETWLSTNIPDSMLTSSTGYTIIRKDRELGTIGGGVAILIKNSIKFTLVDIPPNFIYLDCLVIDLHLSGQHSYRMACVYQPPSKSNCIISTGELCSFIDFCTSCTFRSFLIGDFNYPSIDWDIPLSFGDACHNLFLETIMRNNLHQVVTQPTRLDNCLDLLFTSEPLLVNEIEVIEPFTLTCDHNAIDFSLSIPSHCTARSPSTQFNFRKADYSKISDYIKNIDWFSVLESCNGDVESFWKSLTSIFDYCIEQFVPKYKNRRHKSKYPKNIRCLALKKRCAYRHHKSTPNRDTKAKFTKLSRDYNAAIKSFNTQREQSLLDEPSLAKFYSFINSKLQNHSTTPSMKDQNGNIITSAKEKANVFNNYFSTVFTKDDGLTPDIPQQADDNSFLSHINFSYANVLRALLDLPNKTSRSPDGYPAYFLKNIAHVIALPLSVLFELSLMHGCIPEVWKTAFVLPIFKKGKSSLCQNYRPVSLTCISCKVMEAVIVRQMLDYLRKNNLLTKEQHGFLSRRSTTTQLLDTLQTWSNAVNKRLRVDTIYVDFSKAFDTVSHSKLLIKLKAYGIDYELLNWISTFLHGRTQVVCMDDEISNPLDVVSGVPQGSVIGPLLFIIFINDIITCLEDECQIKLFADDAKIFSCRKNSNNDDLSRTLDNLCLWADKWQLRIAFEKCSTFSVGNMKVPSCQYYLSGYQLQSVDRVKDLGVILTSDLKTSAHCSMISAKAYSRSYLILKCFSSRDPELLIKAFKVYVRPILENVSPAWNPRLQKDINILERVQRYFTRRLSSPKSYYCKETYPERLQTFNLESLETRRIKNDLIIMYKITHNMLDLDITKFGTFDSSKYNMRGHSLKLKQLTIPKLDVVKNQFSHRVIPWWNTLLDSCVTAKSVSSFKRKLDNINLKPYCIQNI